MWRVVSKGVGDLLGIKATTYFTHRHRAIKHLLKLAEQHSGYEHRISFLRAEDYDTSKKNN